MKTVSPVQPDFFDSIEKPEVRQLSGVEALEVQYLLCRLDAVARHAKRCVLQDARGRNFQITSSNRKGLVTYTVAVSTGNPTAQTPDVFLPPTDARMVRALANDNEEAEMQSLIGLLAAGMAENCLLNLKQVVEVAREANLLRKIVGVEGNPPLSNRQAISLGRKLERVRDQTFADVNGRSFVIDHRKMKRGAAYKFIFHSGKPGASLVTTTPV